MGGGVQSFRSALEALSVQIKPQKYQFLLNLLLALICGACLSVSKFSMVLMAGTKDKNLYYVDSAAGSTAFILSFGLGKAIFNLVVGPWADNWGRKQPHIWGWVIGLVGCGLVISATSWPVVVCANVLIGIQQALCWSTTILMMVDYAGKPNSGVAVGMNETIGYMSVAVFGKVAALLVNESARNYEREPFYLVAAMMVTGLTLSVLCLRDSKKVVDIQSSQEIANGVLHVTPFRAFVLTTCVRRNMMLMCQAGMMCNIMTGLAWGLVVQWMRGGNEDSWAVDTVTIAGVLLAYAMCKGISQAPWGFISDRVGRKQVLVGAMLTCSVALSWLAAAGTWARSNEVVIGHFYVGAVLLGTGTGVMYPNLAAAVMDECDSAWKATAMGTFRFWRDLGYAVGAVGGGLLADELGSVPATIGAVAVAALLSALLLLLFYRPSGRTEAEVKFRQMPSNWLPEFSADERMSEVAMENITDDHLEDPESYDGCLEADDIDFRMPISSSEQQHILSDGA